MPPRRGGRGEARTDSNRVVRELLSGGPLKPCRYFVQLYHVLRGRGRSGATRIRNEARDTTVFHAQTCPVLLD